MRKLFFIAFQVFIAFLAFAAPAYAKDYSIGAVDISVTINPDRSFDVSESRVYNFDGSFSWADLWIPTRIERQGYTYNISITDFEVQDEAGATLRSNISQSGGKFYAKWFYSARDESKTFTWSYHVTGEGVKKYQDIGEFYWQIIGDEWVKSCGPVTVTVNLPPDASKDEIKVFGHLPTEALAKVGGPEKTLAEIVDGQTTRFTVPKLPAKTFVEIRTLFPAQLLSGPTSSEKTLADILAEEEGFRQETIAKLNRQKWLTRLFLFYIFAVLPLSIILWFFFYWRAWKSKGKEYDFPDVPKYVRELPSGLPPALVDVLLKQGGKSSTEAFVATIFDLARRGLIRIEDEVEMKSGFFGAKRKTKTTLHADYSKARGELEGHQMRIFDFIFGKVAKHGESVLFSDLKEYFKKHAYSVHAWFEKWYKGVQKESRKAGFLEKEGTALTKKFWIASGLMILLGSPVIIPGIFLIPKLKRWKKEWAREAALWKSFKKFLDDFSSFKEIPPEAYKLWEHYLVFGILFGNAKGILKALPVILEDPRATPAVWYYGVSVDGAPASFSSMSVSLSSLTSSFSQVSASSISTGGGGGFSGGGGGGGGGGGSGAG